MTCVPHVQRLQYDTIGRDQVAPAASHVRSRAADPGSRADTSPLHTRPAECTDGISTARDGQTHFEMTGGERESKYINNTNNPGPSGDADGRDEGPSRGTRTQDQRSTVASRTRHADAPRTRVLFPHTVTRVTRPICGDDHAPSK